LGLLTKINRGNTFDRLRANLFENSGASNINAAAVFN